MSRDKWGLGNVYQRREGGIWWIHYTVNGRTFRESSKSTKKGVATELLKQRIGEAKDGKLSSAKAQSTTVDELLNDLLRDYRNNGKSIEWAEIVVEKHLRGFFGYWRAIDVTTDRINAYIDKRRSLGRANATINRELALLRRSFKLGQSTTPRKVGDAPQIKKLEEDNVRKGFFERSDFVKLRADLPDEIQPLVTFAYYTGCRKGEILKLRWDQVDLEHRLVRLESGETKNKEARLLPIPEELHRMLASSKEQRDAHWPHSPWVFNRQGDPIKSFRTAWENACVRTGLAKSEGRAKKLMHDLRRTGVRNLVRSGTPELVAMKISGHKTRAVFDRYNIVSEDDIHEARRRLDQQREQK